LRCDIARTGKLCYAPGDPGRGSGHLQCPQVAGIGQNVTKLDYIGLASWIPSCTAKLPGYAMLSTNIFSMQWISFGASRYCIYKYFPIACNIRRYLLIVSGWGLKRETETGRFKVSGMV